MPHMPSKPPTHRPAGLSHVVRAPRLSPSKRGYGRAWEALRAAHLAKHPLCVHCLPLDLTVEATEVDHITPHGGDRRKLFDRKNLQSLCKPCHSRKTVTIDGGLGRGRVEADRPTNAT